QEPGRVIPLAVRNGRCECIVPAETPGEKYYLVVGSLARSAGPYPVNVRTEPTELPLSLPLEKPMPDEGWARRVRELNERLARRWKREQFERDNAPAREPPVTRTFYLFIRENGFENAAGYVAVTADLRAVGRHCQVYLDRDQGDPAAVQPTVDDIVRTFDGEIYPRACQRLGRAVDVDRDGRFTILLTAWLNRLCDGKVAVSGFVRGSDFWRDLAAPFGNRCDMMYLNPDLKPGPHLHAVLAHEFTHAVVFTEHVFGNYLPEMPRQDEESWLNEALAHLNEDSHQFGWSNLGHRIRAYLNAPERYQLVVPDYYGAGLWRSHGNRGATYLFLRWCTDQHDSDLPRRLVQTNLFGTTNLEVATQERFADLFRDWSVAVLLSGTNLRVAEPRSLRRLDLFQPLGGHLLCGPRVHSLRMTNGCREIKLAGTAAAYLLLHSPGGARSRITVTADPLVELQASLVRLPRSTARLDLRWEPGNKPGTGRLVLSAYDADVTLDAADVEPLGPAGRCDEEDARRPASPEQQARKWFATLALQGGDTRRSKLITLPAPGKEHLFKVTATDAAGHRIAARAVLPPENECTIKGCQNRSQSASQPGAQKVAE
ncbi:MAG TPA: hypothetical protein VKI65_12360, partial [Gemmataceae bacterium]|nr:hypothetical protein [Gemmataceae bacterium]